jgi:hypothetical protein
MQERRKNFRNKVPLDIPLYEQDSDHILGFLAIFRPGGCVFIATSRSVRGPNYN